MSKKRTPFIFFFIIAFLIRLISLNQSLWLDEAITAKVVMNYSLRDIIRQFSPFDFHPPLYYLLLKLWSNIFGYSEISLRLPSIIFSLLTGYLLYLLGKNLFNKTTGFWAAMFFLFNPLVVYYSQEARMYMMVTFLITFSIYFFFKIQNSKIKNQDDKSKLKINLFFFILFFSLSFYTFYGSIFLIATIIIYLIFKREFKIFFITALVFLISTIVIFPLIHQQLINSKIQLTEVKNWSLVLGQANIKNLLLIPIKFSFGRISFYPKWAYWLLAGLWTIFVWKRILIQIKTRKYILPFFLFFPIFLAFIFSIFTPLLSYFRFLYLLPIFCLSLALSNAKKIYDHLEKTVVIFGFFLLSGVYLLNSAYHREDWKSLSHYLKNRNQKTYIIEQVSDPLRYYEKKLELYDLKKILLKEDDSSQSIKSIEENYLIIPYATEIFGINYQNKMLSLDFYLKNKKSFRQLTLEEWERKK